jgi:threonine aldolase
MRQAGILAAAGIVALERMVDRLAEDHARARYLAEGLSEIPGLLLDPGSPATNMIFFSLADSIKLSPAQIEKKMEERGVLTSACGPRRFRLVTHVWIDDAGANQTVAAFREVLQ